MVLIGKTYGNLMVDVRTGSEKLRDRARRMVHIVTGIDVDAADALLKRAHWNVKAAIVMQKTGLSYQKALSRLRRSHDRLRDAIGEDIEPRLRDLLAGGTGAVLTPPVSAAPAVGASAVAAAGSSRTSTAPCTCSHDAGNAVVSGPPPSPRPPPPSTSRSPARRIRRACRIAVIPIVSARGGTALDVAAERRGVGRPGLRVQRGDVGGAPQHRPRLVEADVAVGAESAHQQVDPAGGMRSPGRSGRTRRRHRPVSPRRNPICARGRSTAANSCSSM